MIPKGSETPRTRQLQDIVDATPTKEFLKWPQPTREDFILIGLIVALYSYMDFQLHRMLESLDRADAIESSFHGKSGRLNMHEVTKAILTAPDWSEENINALKRIQEFRGVRNMLAHFVVRRFPKDDAFVCLTKSARDYKQAFGVEPPSGVALTGVMEVQQLKNLATALEGLQRWLVTATNEVEAVSLKFTK